MTNLDKILDRIKTDGEDRAIALDRETDEELARLKAQADENVAEEVAALEEQAARDAKKIVTLANSSAIALRKKRALEAKSRALDEAVAQAAAALAALPEEDYVSLILALVERYTDATPGRVLLAAGRPVKDTAGFGKKLAALPGKNLTLAQETAEIATGVLVSYGKIEVDLSFDALIAEKKDDVRDRLAQLIFRDAAKE